MKHSFKLVALCLYTALGLMIQGCGPETRITGRVLDDQAGTAVPGTAVLGMVWLEDGDKALPVPDTGNLKSEDRDMALDKDTKDRGLPAAYARTFTDSDGRFELTDFHFSAATKKAVKAMKQPKITRVTVWAFQKGYRKQAVTMFPKNYKKEIPAATMLLVKPADWKELYLDNIVDTLTQDFMLKGYSKEFGATKAEKSWIFEYTRANEQRAYDTSDIKGDKKAEELCGHDYSDIIVSTAGIQRNPAHEKCGELLKRIGAIREVEELWLTHSNMKQDPLAVAKEVVSRALNALSSEIAEPKEYEAMIFEGLKNAVEAQSRDDMRNGVSDPAWQDEAKLQYGKGDKTMAYRALGYALYNQLPEEIQRGVITAQLSVRTIPGIKETAAGFYLLMNRPLTAQLPNGDNSNHKDKPGYKVEGATEAASVSGAATNLKIADLDKLVAEGKGEKEADGVYTLRDRVVINGKEFTKTEHGALFSSLNSEYFLFNDFNPKQGYIARLLDKKGNLLWDLKDPGDISQALISDKGVVALFYGVIGTTSVVLIIDKSGREIRTIAGGDSISGDILENLYQDHAQFAKNSDMLFVLAYFTEKQLVLLGIDETGEIKYFQQLTGSPIKDVNNWYARVYFNPKRSQLLIDSSGIGEDPPMLSYWAFPQKRLFTKRIDKEEVISNASFADNDDILLLVKRKDGTKVVRRLDPYGTRKSEKSDIRKMDTKEQGVIHDKLIKVRSLNWGRE